MKKATLLKTMLLLCALIVGNANAWAAAYTGTFKKCSGTLASGTYMIGDVSGTTLYAINNTVGNSWIKYTEVTVSSNQVVNPDETLVWEYDATTGYIKSQDGTNYLYWPGGGNKGGCGTTAYAHTITEPSTGIYRVASSADDTRFIKINTQNAGYRYYNSGSSALCFFKKEESAGPVDPAVDITTSTIALGGTATISGPAGLSISFSGYDVDVVSVSSAGVVTGLAAGSTTITATWSAVSGTYNAGSKDFDVTVVEATIYEKVTSVNQLVAGNKYILVAPTSNVAMGAVNAGNSSIRDYVDVTIVEDKVTIVDEAVAVLTLGGETDDWTFLASDNDLYLALNSASNAIHTSADASADAAKWTVTNDFQLMPNSYSRYLRYNSGSPRFACYEKNQVLAYLFVKSGSDVSTTININADCTDGEGNYYATYSNDKAFRVPADLTVSTIKVNDGKLALTNYNTGDIVKAGTGVMISSASSGDHTLILTEAEGTENDDNMLKASGDDGIDAATMDVANTKFYRLTMADGKPGFWWKAENGASFALAANKAYLAVPEAQAARGFSLFDEGETTGISTTLMNNERMNNEVYNLNGQRVAQPTKGLYIVNGKIVVIK